MSISNETFSLKRNAQRLLPPGLNAMPPIVLMATNDDVPIASGDFVDLSIIVPEKYPYHIFGMTGMVLNTPATAIGPVTINYDYKIAIYQGAGAWHDKNVGEKCVALSYCYYVKTIGNV